MNALNTLTPKVRAQVTALMENEGISYDEAMRRLRPKIQRKARKNFLDEKRARPGVRGGMVNPYPGMYSGATTATRN